MTGPLQRLRPQMTVTQIDPRRLVANVFVDLAPNCSVPFGTWWGPDYGNADRVPADIAAQITNPACWEPTDPRSKP